MATVPSCCSFLSFFFFLLFSLSLPFPSSSSPEEHQTYIIHVDASHKPFLFSTHHVWYASIIRSLPPSSPPAELLYTYSRVVTGFSARLTASQCAALRRIHGVLSVVREQVRQVDTTRTPQFLGLSDQGGLWPLSDYGDNVIIGVLDTGIWPEHPSFSDAGLGPVPPTWKGTCDVGPDFPASSCNRKIIGARAFNLGHRVLPGRPNDKIRESTSPRDTQGHGTHVASTAAGARVLNASFFQYALGEARGIATKARIAVYKICWSNGCPDADILAGMDQAVADGVNVISLSVGAQGLAPQYYQDSIAIGTFGAMQNGIFVSCSAGNNGPTPYTVNNIAPWIMTVGASTIYRQFLAYAYFGNGMIFKGQTLYAGNDSLPFAWYPIVYAGDAGSRECYPGKLEPSKVGGKIVLCEAVDYIGPVTQGYAVKIAGGFGMVLANMASEDVRAASHVLPATMVGASAGNKILTYVKTDSSPAAAIWFSGTVIGQEPPAPMVASFSGRGPNHLTQEILKPDVIAPGVDILAGWSGAAPPTNAAFDPRRVEFNIISGTSMACPHVSGLGGLLHAVHPDWSPAAIRSALMTTAYNFDNSGNIIKDMASGDDSNPFIRGAGHVNPEFALDPGLVYDLKPQDYISFLCSIGYDSDKIAVFLGHRPPTDICKSSELSSPGDLNYPSISVLFRSTKDVVKYVRTVTNVGSNVHAVYEAKVEGLHYAEVVVSPTKLVFGPNATKLSYNLTFTSNLAPRAEKWLEFGALEWSDGAHVVRSPLAVEWRLALMDSI